MSPFPHDSVQSSGTFFFFDQFSCVLMTARRFLQTGKEDEGSRMRWVRTEHQTHMSLHLSLFFNHASTGWSFLVLISLKEGIQKRNTDRTNRSLFIKTVKCTPLGSKVWVFLNICEVGSKLMQIIDSPPIPGPAQQSWWPESRF